MAENESIETEKIPESQKGTSMPAEEDSNEPSKTETKTLSSQEDSVPVAQAEEPASLSPEKEVRDILISNL